MATGENFKRIHWMNLNKKEQIKVDKKTEQIIKAEIKKLQNERTLLYERDDIPDEEWEIKSREIQEKINKLIEAIY